MNARRIVIGGIVAGVILFVAHGIANGPLLMARYKALQEAHILQMQPRLNFPLAWGVLMLFYGIGLAWFYAAVRPRLGAGPGTAVLVGIVVGLMANLPGAVSTYAWTFEGGYVALVQFLGGLVGSIVGALLAGAIYKEPAAG